MICLILDNESQDVEVVEQENQQLSQELLDLLGQEGCAPSVGGPAIQKDLAVRWNNILAKGLSKEVRDNIMGLYPPPENCTLLSSPNLNPVVAAAISESVKKRDARLALIQRQVGASLAAIGRVLTPLLSAEGGGDRHQLIRCLSDASRLLTDVFFSETTSRRELIAINLNKELKETLNNAPPDGWLFGENLEERVKATKSIARSSQDLKPPRSKQSNLGSSSSSKALNFKSLSRPRQQQGVHQGGHISRTFRTPRTQQRQVRPPQERGSRRPVGNVRLTRRQ